MIESAFQFHRHTSYRRHEMTSHYLDWQNRPAVYKHYPHIRRVQLPRTMRLTEQTFHSLLQEDPIQEPARIVSLEELSSVLLLTYSLTAKARHSDGDFYYRSVASAGALYPAEVYVAPFGVSGLDNGLYHFSIAQHALVPLRKGNLFPCLARAIQWINAEAPTLTFFLSSIFFRSAWKYRDRSYRYHLLDTGHVLENLLWALKALRLPSPVSYDFNDRDVNILLGLDESKEVCLAACQVPSSLIPEQKGIQIIPGLPQTYKAASRVAREEVDYAAIQEIHQAGAKVICPSGCVPPMVHELGIRPDTWEQVQLPDIWAETTTYTKTVLTRRSRRNFVQSPLPQSFMNGLLDALCATSLDTPSIVSKWNDSIGIGFLVGRVEELDPGFYLLDSHQKQYGKTTSGFLMDKMAHICLDQTWLANAAVHFVFMTNLEILDHLWGARGYRYAMMTAGRLGERLYLSATAMGQGCCGIGAFYDREAVELLGLNAISRMLYLVAVGPIKSKLR